MEPGAGPEVESSSQGAARGYYSPQVRGAEPLTLASPVCLFEDEELGEDRGTSLNKEKNVPPGQSLVLRAICPYLQAGRQRAAPVSHLGIVYAYVCS